MKKPPGGEPGGLSLRTVSRGRKFLRVVVCPEALDHGVELVDREQEKIILVTEYDHGQLCRVCQIADVAFPYFAIGHMLRATSCGPNPSAGL
jgi:hypothetical protein